MVESRNCEYLKYRSFFILTLFRVFHLSPDILPAPCFHTPTIHVLPMWWEMKFDTIMKLKWNLKLVFLNPYLFGYMRRQNILNYMIASISKIEKLFWISILWLSLQQNICSIYQISIFHCMRETSKQNSWNNTIHFSIPYQECCITVWCCVRYVSFEFFSMVIEDSGFLVCVTTLMGKWFLTLWWMFDLLGLKVHGPWSFRDEGDLSFQNLRNQLSSDTVSHFRIL